ncbi:hypothetical protein M9H77_32604 [Catharanthus roseus]|uniref:Uncharacterized protein n=1 Tax=Catharanthus roseus TaxID=4058 RepID=A0ACC0A4M8_CATRO|nr:hypothetical protein M9H77_32604 [Catharanthus roseus]
MMSGFEDNWGLQAIVGGKSFSSAISALPIPNSSCYSIMDHMSEHRDLANNFPDLFETMFTDDDRLEQLYKPFYPVVSSDSSSESIIQQVEEKLFVEEDEKKSNFCPVESATTVDYVPKYKRRKNQQKRVVIQVTAEDLSSDKWAWRKYGQKPIKGSPYPRSYYRCSSSKGCLARKQVEQSCKDPSIFIVTYTAEHSHSQPTKKNALAGTVRHKFPNPKTPSKATSSSSKLVAKAKDSSSSVPSPLIPSVENVKQEMMSIEEDDNNIIFSGVKLDDEFFSGLEDLDELISELGMGCGSSKLFPTS